MGQLDNIVLVTITRETKLPTQVGFGTPLIIDINTVQSNKVDTFSTLQEMLDLGFTTSDEAYKAAAAMMAQSPHPPQFKVGKRDANVVQVNTVTVDTAENDTTYTCTINGTVFSYLSDADATVAEISAGLVAAINAGSEPVTAADLTGSYTLTADNAGIGFSVVVDANQTSVATIPNTGVASELAAMQVIDDDFYFVISTDRVQIHVVELAEYIETQVKLYFVDDDDADSKDLPESTDTTSLLAVLKDANYDRTSFTWSADQASYPAAAWVGLNATKDPGSITWKFWTVNSVTADDLTTTEKTNVWAKNGNTYTTVGGVSIFESGTVVSGEFIDIMRGTDWIQARMQEAVYGLLVTEDKIPFDDGGIEQVKLQVKKILQRAEDRSILRADPKFTVTAPLSSEVPTADRAIRYLQDVEFGGYYAGAVHKVKIVGKLSI